MNLRPSVKRESPLRQSLALLAVFVVVMAGCSSSTPVERDDKDASSVVKVELTVDFGAKKQSDGEASGEDKNALLEIKLDLNLSSPATVLDALQEASEQGKLVFEYRGSGETAFIHSLGGVANEGMSGSNWVFYVNDTLGDRGAGAFLLEPNDRLLWKFKTKGLQ